ncbi:UvrD-helicase domain-containing protein [Nonomuraea sp. M3C6]|uniref:UvrD-helicase domain-containing protein n=1 Tax=Nonomuraea marmarensis TaxID=3351344 RepID=A0ABW7AP10_9ACTN
MAPKPTLEQTAIVDAFTPGDKNLVVEAGAGAGKALRADQPVLTPTGWRPIAELAVGDPIIGRDGLTYDVSGVYPQGVRPLYAIRLSDGNTVIADAEHRWLVQHHKRRDRGTPGEVLTTAQILERGLTRPAGNGARWFLPMPEPVKLPEAELPLDPWLLGLLLGDGMLGKGTLVISTADAPIIDRVRALVEPMGVTATPNPTRPIDYRLSARRTTKPGHRGFWNPLVEALKGLGLRGVMSHEKFVPQVYAFASADQRLELLRGLLDSDGHRSNGDSAEFVTTSSRLAEDVRWLVQSLGGTATLVEKPTTHKLAYRMRIKLPAHLVPFWLERKAAGWCDDARVIPFRAIRSITPVEPGEAVCISVTAPDHLYLTTGCIPTHNTSTLKMAAAATPGRRGLYIAYNRAIKEDAEKSFPKDVICKTAHGLAYGAVGKLYARRLRAPRMPSLQIAKLLRINSPLYVPGGIIPPAVVARIVMSTVAKFCHSAHTNILLQSVPRIPGFDDPETMRVLAAEIPLLAMKAWEDLTRVDGKLPFSHDVYLKIYSMSGPQLPYDYVLMDEAQDANPPVTAIVEGQRNAQKVLVGDQSQAIYGWRGSSDAMAGFDGVRLTLSQSFRFGPAVAEEANKWLEYLDAPLRLRGFEQINSRIDALAEPDALLCRTNAATIAAAMDAMKNGSRVALVGGGKSIAALAEAAIQLKAGAGCSHPELYAFKTWGEVQDYCENEEAGSDLAPFVKLIDSHGADVVLDIVGRLTSEDRADLVLSTAHKAKGREWHHVKVADDFSEPKPKDDGSPGMIRREDAMLAYVTVTRAQYVLDNAGLAWIDNYL